MGEELFGEQEKAVTILYEGSAREWESIEKRTELSGCTVIFNTEFPRLPKKVKKQSKARLSADSKGAGR